MAGEGLVTFERWSVETVLISASKANLFWKI